jgi:hypothetical protein
MSRKDEQTNTSKFLEFSEEINNKNLSEAIHIPRLATLCDDPVGLTCSMDAAKRWGKAQKIYPFDSFEKACKATKDGQVDAFLVPAAYPRLNTFIMDNRIQVKHVFVMKIPALVFAGLSGCTSSFEKIYHHPAVTPLLTELDVTWNAALTATSNSDACRLVIASGRNTACVTNALCAKHFNLQILKILRSGILMPWICFEKLPDVISDMFSIKNSYA